jgi:hypothetical protein
MRGGLVGEKVVGLRGRAVVDGREPRADVVELAERIAEMARSGEIVGLAATWGFADDSTGARLRGIVGYSTVGRLEGLKADILRDLE